MRRFISHAAGPVTMALSLTLTAASFGQGGVNERFERSSPAVGQPLPELTCYDAAGAEVKLHEVKGHYTVLVFGCLT